MILAGCGLIQTYLFPKPSRLCTCSTPPGFSPHLLHLEGGLMGQEESKRKLLEMPKPQNSDTIWRINKDSHFPGAFRIQVGGFLSYFHRVKITWWKCQMDVQSDLDYHKLNQQQLWCSCCTRCGLFRARISIAPGCCSKQASATEDSLPPNAHQ